MTYPLSIPQYETLKEKLAAAPDVALTSSGPNAGTITTPQVSLSYTYDGSTNITIATTARHGFFVQHASQDTIDQHIATLIRDNLA